MALGLAAVVLLAASAVSAHTSAVLMPPGGDYLIRWYQPHSVLPVANWEIEIVTQRYPYSTYVVSAQVMPDESCWALNVPVNQPATVRVRSVAGTQVSSWSRPTVVPEPDSTVGLLVAAGALASSAAASSRRSARAR